ncbi:hypothetical protein [Mucilaginibacter sp.]
MLYKTKAIPGFAGNDFIKFLTAFNPPAEALTQELLFNKIRLE